MKLKYPIFGADYNPEQWSDQVVLEDIRLMKELGVNLVSIGIFSWARIQISENEFQFDWLDQLMDRLADNGIGANLATPTAVPPAWMVRKYPEILPVGQDGTTLWHGSRRHVCPHSPVYRNSARKIVQKLAERYKDHPALAMWHIDNEYGCHNTECFCDNSAAAFRTWLKNKYGSLDQLNSTWGTTFWGQTYSEWNEIIPPRTTPAIHNPTHELDWKRFCSDSWIDCFIEQKDAIKFLTPEIPVTTNLMGFHKGVDYFKLAPHLDIVAEDLYPDVSKEDWQLDSAMICDLIRSVGNGKPWVLMEQASAHVNWRPVNYTKEPGVMRRGSLQAMARGADGIMYFQWRASRFGAEKFHSAIVSHSGTDNRTYREVSILADELPQYEPICGSRVKARAALLFDWENWWAIELGGKPNNHFDMVQMVSEIYRALHQNNITVDFVHPEGNYSKYALVIAPNLYLTKDEVIDNLHNYVTNGGNLVINYFSAIVDENDHIRLDTEKLYELLGLRIAEYTALPDDSSVEVIAEDNLSFRGSFWCDLLEPRSATPIMFYNEKFFKGTPSSVINLLGKGSVTTIGTRLDKVGMNWIVNRILKDTGLLKKEHSSLTNKVEIVDRTDGKRSWLFYLNHSSDAVEIEIPAGMHLISDAKGTENTLTIPAGGVAITQSKVLS